MSAYLDKHRPALVRALRNAHDIPTAYLNLDKLGAKLTKAHKFGLVDGYLNLPETEAGLRVEEGAERDRREYQEGLEFGRAFRRD